MTNTSRRAFAGAALVAAVAVGGGPALAQDYPTKPITMIIPLGAGGSHDLNARVMTSVLPEYLGQPVVVQLMPGASGQTGTAAAAEAAADGYTLLFTHNFIDQLQQHVTDVPYDPLEDFVTVARTNYASPSVVVRADSRFETFEDLVQYGKENAGELSFGHSGQWGALMVPGAALLQAADVEATLVPYQGGGPAMQALLAEDVDFSLAFPSVVLAQGDAVRALGTVGDERVLEGVPTTTELGYEGVAEIGTMHRVVLAPAGVPEDRLETLRSAFAEMSEDGTYQTLLEKIGENNEFMDGAEYEAIRERQAEAYAELVSGMTQ